MDRSINRYLDRTEVNILLVEDDTHNSERLGELLKAAGYNVKVVLTTDEALRAEHNNFDLAVVNGEMYDRSGVSLLSKMQQHPTFSRLPLLIISDDASIPISNAVLRRPYDDSELLRRIDQFLHVSQTGNQSSQTRRENTLLTEDDIPTQPVRLTLDTYLQQQLAELKILSNLGRSISSVLELNVVLNQIVEAATTLTRAEEGLLLLPDEEGKALYLRAMKGVDDERARTFRVKAEDPLIGRVYTSGKPVLITDNTLKRVATQYLVKALLYVPMNYKGQTIGVLGVNNRVVDRVFTKHDEELLLDLAAHAAIAIENARLYEDRLLQNRQLAMLVASGKAVNSTLALGDVLSIICQQMIQTLQTNACVITQWDAETATLHPLAGARRTVWLPDDGPVTSLDERPVLRTALEQNAFYAVSRKHRDANFQYELAALNRDGASQMLVLPIRPGNKTVIGILELFYNGSAPEVTSDFRSALRIVCLETFALLRDNPNSRISHTVITNAQKLLELSYANWLTLSLYDERTHELTRVAEYGAAVFLMEASDEPEVYPSTMAAFNDNTVLNYHAKEVGLPDEVHHTLTHADAGALLSLPVMIKNSPFGAVTIYNNVETRRFRAHEISLAWALVTQAATAIENARLYNDLEQSLSALRSAQAKLVESARLSTMGELAAVVAHQINNPLTTIMADSEMFLQDTSPGEPLHDALNAINRAGKRAHSVVKRLLSTARRSDPDEPLQVIDVYETLQNTLELVTSHIERSRVRIEVAINRTMPAYTMAAPGHLEDLWLNLLLNARDALINFPNATITIQSAFTESALNISISDNGPGIPAENLERIFQPFFTTKPAGEGTGLGLHICKQIVDKCNGVITVQSTVGVGTSFTVSLPLVSEKAAENAAALSGLE